MTKIFVSVILFQKYPLCCTDLYIYTLSKKNYRRISNAKKSPHTYHVADVCSHREIEHASEVNEGKFECYQTWFLSYSKSNFSWKMKRGDKRTYICSIYTFLVLPPSNKPPFKLRRKTNHLSSFKILCHLRIVNFLCHQTQLNTANVY